MATSPAQVSPTGFDRLYGLEVLQLDGRHATAKVAVHDGLRRPTGPVHGGVYAAIADGLATSATEHALPDKATAAMSSQTSVLRPVTGGTIHAAALARHRGRTTWVWEVEMTDDEGQLCAVARVTIAVGDRPGG
jgi:uncharacterized protein (TIGR00369 family)